MVGESSSSGDECTVGWEWGIALLCAVGNMELCFYNSMYVGVFVCVCANLRGVESHSFPLVLQHLS